LLPWQNKPPVSALVPQSELMWQAILTGGLTLTEQLADADEDDEDEDED